MKQFPVFLLALTVASSAQEESNFTEKFAELKKGADPAALHKFITESEKTEAENPDFYALASNYWWGQSQQISINSKPAEPGDFAIKKLDGTQAGSISSVGKSNPAIPERALTLVHTGFDKFPSRLDLGFGLATLQRKLQKKAELEKTLLKILKVAENPDDLTWTENRKLPGEPSVFVPQSVHPYVRYFFDQESEEDDNRVDRLTKRLTEVFPKHPYAWNMRAALASVRKDDKGIILNLEKAHELAPEDALILLNLADSYKKQNQPEKAREAATRILAIESAAARHKDAEAILKSLEPVKK